MQCIRGAGRRRAQCIRGVGLIRRRWSTAALETVVDGGGVALLDERTAAAKTKGSASTKTKELFRSRASAQIYRGGPFSTGPWLEPVLKGL